MNKTVDNKKHSLRQTGFTLVEMMVSITISLVVLSGVVQALVVSKNNFITQREMATLQENARFALKYMTDEIRLAGAISCSQPSYIADVIKGNTGSWYLDVPGLQGYEYDNGVGTFPAAFGTGIVKANTDAIAIRRGEATALKWSAHAPGTSTFTFTAAHSYKPGQVMMVVSPDCQNIGMFQMSGPANAANTATTMLHATGTAVPGNAVGALFGGCTYNAAGVLATGTACAATAYPAQSVFLALHSEAYYIANSESDATVPALFRQRMTVNTVTNTPVTVAEELVQGVDNMQILYGLDIYNSSTGVAGNDGLADAYVKATSITGAGAMLWSNVVSVRITLRLRSISPVYNNNETYPVFEGVTGTDGADRFMRQTISSTIMVRNYKL